MTIKRECVDLGKTMNDMEGLQINEIGLTVSELIEKLQGMPQDMEVVIGIWSNPIVKISKEVHKINGCAFESVRIYDELSQPPQENVN